MRREIKQQTVLDETYILTDHGYYRHAVELRLPDGSLILISGGMTRQEAEQVFTVATETASEHRFQVTVVAYGVDDFVVERVPSIQKALQVALEELGLESTEQAEAMPIDEFEETHIWIPVLALRNPDPEEDDICVLIERVRN